MNLELLVLFCATHLTYGIGLQLGKFPVINTLYERGWASLKRYENHTLAYTPFKSVNVTSPVGCAEECILAKEADCTSINLKRDVGFDHNGTELFLCSLMDISRYYFPALFKASNYTDFYEIFTDCHHEYPCITYPQENTRCLPGDSSPHSTCVCASYFEGAYCEKYRNTTTQYTFSSTNPYNYQYYTIAQQQYINTFYFWWKGTQEENEDKCLFDVEIEKIMMTAFLMPGKQMKIVIKNNIMDIASSGPINYEINQWNHIGCSFDAQDIRPLMHCFLNGNLIFKHNQLERDGKTFSMKIGQTHLTSESITIDTVPAMIVKESNYFGKFFMKEAFELVYKSDWIPPNHKGFLAKNELQKKENVPRNGRD